MRQEKKRHHEDHGHPDQQPFHQGRFLGAALGFAGVTTPDEISVGLHAHARAQGWRLTAG
jgi:hypothetical protein